MKLCTKNINDFLEDYLPMDVLKVYSYLYIQIEQSSVK